MSLPERGNTATLTRSIAPSGRCAQRILHLTFGDGDAWRCWYCSAVVLCGCWPAAASRRATVDHLYPVIRGGLNTPENTVPACSRCNQAKGMALYPNEWSPATGLNVAAVLQAPLLRPGARLSARAYGVLSMVRADPELIITPPALAARFTEGRDAMRVTIGELVAAGHLRITADRDGNLIRWQFGLAA